MWIVRGTKREGAIELVSKGSGEGILPIGSFLTVIDDRDANKKFILRVDDSKQEEIFKPSLLLIEADLKLPYGEQKCTNIVSARRIFEKNIQADDMAAFIRPGLLARRSTQDEIDEALSLSKEGVKVFLATTLHDRASVLKGLDGKYIMASIPTDAFYHQMIIAGKTGSGKTTALKYLAQYFVEEMGGAVIAVNVKGKDLLYMNKPSGFNEENTKEWKQLDKSAHGVENFRIYVPFKANPDPLLDIDRRIVQYITLSVDDIEPNALADIMRLTEIGESMLPDVFRFWQERVQQPGNRFSDFVSYFSAPSAERGAKVFHGISSSGNEPVYTFPPSTYNSINRELNFISQYFDASDSNAITLDAETLIQRRTMTALHLTEDIQFGSILLRDLIKKIREHIIEHHDVPVLFIIDETHLFYDSNSSKTALEDLSVICRTGRQHRAAIVFASQNPNDIPRDLASVVATKIFFQSEKAEARNFGLTVDQVDIETLPKGYAAVKIFEQPHLRLIKFPKAFGGVDNG